MKSAVGLAVPPRGRRHWQLRRTEGSTGGRLRPGTRLARLRTPVKLRATPEPRSPRLLPNLTMRSPVSAVLVARSGRLHSSLRPPIACHSFGDDVMVRGGPGGSEADDRIRLNIAVANSGHRWRDVRRAGSVSAETGVLGAACAQRFVRWAIRVLALNAAFNARSAGEPSDGIIPTLRANCI